MLVLDLLPGLLLAVAPSLALFIGNAGNLRLAVIGRLPGTDVYGDTSLHEHAATTPGVLAVRPDGSLFFGNAERVKDHALRLCRTAEPTPHALVLDLTATFHLGIPVLDTLEELRDALERNEVKLHLAHVRGLADTTLRLHPLAVRLGPGQVHQATADAVTAAARRTRPARRR